MMKKNNFLILSAAAALFISGCQPAPSKSSSRDDSSATASESTTSSAISYDVQPTTEAPLASAQETTVIPECDSHTSEMISSESITISIDANIIKPECEVLHCFTYQTVDANEVHIEKLINTLWHPDGITTEFDQAQNEYTVTPEAEEDTFTIETKLYQITLNGHRANLCPYGSNAYDSYCDVLLTYTNDEAARVCGDVYSEVCGLDSETLSVISYGKTTGEKYCKIVTAPLIDGLPVIDSHTMNSFDFCDLGVYNAKLYCYEFIEGEPVGKIISLDDAIEQLRQSAEKIMRFADPEMYEIMDYTTNDSGALTRINVNEIRLGYIFGSGSTTDVYPAWIFVPGKEVSDYSLSFAVNAINGELVLI